MPKNETSLAIEGNQTTGALLNGKNGLCVPASQRSYRWKKEHVEALLNDISDNLLEDEYFLGSVVTVNLTATKMEVYDGQQRLATTMVLIAAIRDAFLQIGSQEAKRLAGIVETNSMYSDKRTGGVIPHFILNTNDQPFFLQSCNSPS